MPRASYPGGSERSFVRARLPGPGKGDQAPLFLLAVVLVLTAVQLIW